MINEPKRLQPPTDEEVVAAIAYPLPNKAIIVAAIMIGAALDRLAKAVNGVEETLIRNA